MVNYPPPIKDTDGHWYQSVPRTLDRQRGVTVLKAQNLLTDLTTGAKSGPVVEVRPPLESQYLNGWSNPGWRIHKRFPRVDFGSDMLMYQIQVRKPGDVAHAYYNPTPNLLQEFQGIVMPNSAMQSVVMHSFSDPTHDLSFFTSRCPPPLSDVAMDAFGTQAIAKVEPTNPAVDIVTAYGELLRDGLPSIPGWSTKHGPKGQPLGNIGEEYLNLQFAWSPTIQDGRNFIAAIRHHDTILDQYLRDAGRLVRRKLVGPSTTNSTTTVQTSQAMGSIGTAPNGIQSSLGKVTTHTRTESHMQFSGAFAYSLPDSALGVRIAELDKLYGLSPGLENVWALTPWSWLFDWFFDAGSVINNLQAFLSNGEVMPYGYVVYRATSHVDITWEGTIRQGTQNVPFLVTGSYDATTTKRRGATPYGFGLTWNGFNPFQLSILAALAITRGSNTAH